MISTVVIPTYNDDLRLKWVLEGLCCQTVDDFEVVVVNDGGSDSTEYLVNSYTNRLNIIYCYFGPETSSFRPGQARNRGVSLSSGDQIIFLDSDCVPDEGLVEYYNLVFQPGKAFCSQRRFLPLTRVRPIHHGRVDYTWLKSQSYITPNNISFFQTFNCVYPADVFCEIGGFDEEFVDAGGEDGDLLSRMATYGIQTIDVSQGGKHEICYVTHLDHPVRPWRVNPKPVSRKSGNDIIRNNGPLARIKMI